MAPRSAEYSAKVYKTYMATVLVSVYYCLKQLTVENWSIRITLFQIMALIPAMEMILTQPSGGNVPAFLAKLWKMVNNPEIG